MENVTSQLKERVRNLLCVYNSGKKPKTTKLGHPWYCVAHHGKAGGLSVSSLSLATRMNSSASTNCTWSELSSKSVTDGTTGICGVDWLRLISFRYQIIPQEVFFGGVGNC